MRNTDREAAWEKRVQRIGEWIEAIESGSGPKGLEDAKVVEVRCRLGAAGTGDTLLILKASGTAGEMVAFVGARNLAEAVLAWRQKESAGGLKWREDRPWTGAKE